VQLFSSPCPPRPQRTHNLLNYCNMLRYIAEGETLYA
jgi:hypothetical protein